MWIDTECLAKIGVIGLSEGKSDITMWYWSTTIMSFLTGRCQINVMTWSDFFLGTRFDDTKSNVSFQRLEVSVTDVRREISSVPTSLRIRERVPFPNTISTLGAMVLHQDRGAWVLLFNRTVRDLFFSIDCNSFGTGFGRGGKIGGVLANLLYSWISVARSLFMLLSTPHFLIWYPSPYG